MPRTGWGWQIEPEELRTWILYQDADLAAVHKPAHVVCHPGKFGPWSCLIGACRELLGQADLHMTTRLDRETSGIVVIARSGAMRRQLQFSRPEKTYTAILTGCLREAVTVDQPIGLHPDSAIAIRRAVVPGGQAAVTRFEPLRTGNGLTLARVVPQSGRTHQIRVHAAWLGHSVLGDKIYGPDERLFLEYRETGWTPRLRQHLTLDRHALHAARWQWRTHDFHDPAPPGWDALVERQ